MADDEEEDCCFALLPLELVVDVDPVVNGTAVVLLDASLEVVAVVVVVVVAMVFRGDVLARALSGSTKSAN